MHHLSEKIWWMITFREQLIFPTQLMKMNKYRLLLWIIFPYWKQDTLTKHPPCLKMEMPQKPWYSQNTTPPGVWRTESDFTLAVDTRRRVQMGGVLLSCMLEINMVLWISVTPINSIIKKNLFWTFDEN